LSLFFTLISTSFLKGFVPKMKLLTFMVISKVDGERYPYTAFRSILLLLEVTSLYVMIPIIL
jgi:hypothetical protein